MRKVLKVVFPFYVFPFARYKILPRFNIILYFVSRVLLLFFLFAKKTMFSFQTLLKGTFSLLTCHLQFSITARVIDTKTSISAKSFRPQSSPYFLLKPRTRNIRTNGLERNKTVVFSCLEQMGGSGGRGGRGMRVSETGERIKKYV